MNVQLVSVLIAEGGKLISSLLATRPRYRQEQPSTPIGDVTPLDVTSPETQTKATSTEAGCVPCAIGHFGTCSGLLNEAVRFARKGGVAHTEVIDRVNICLDELNAMERVDLRPEMIVALPAWEKEIADQALEASRGTRHGLESLTTVSDLENLAGSTQSARNDIGRKWFKERLDRLTPEEKMRIHEKLDAQTQKELEDLESMR